MKKFIGGLLGFICAGAILIACGTENADGSCPIGLILGLLLVTLICGYIWTKFFAPKTTHIESETYDDLNKQIEDYASELEDGYHEAEFESVNVTVKVAIRNKTTQIKFKDDAWGNIKTFTETSWQSNIEVLEVTVYDENNKPTNNHDFDESYIEIEYEGGGSWS